MKNIFSFALLSMFYIFSNAADVSTKSTPTIKSKESVIETVTLAAGCFWGVDEFFRKVPGVLETEAGYTGGHLENPKYSDTHNSKSGHAESVQIKFDSTKVTFEKLLDLFFKMHDPTTLNRQGNDRGTQYRSAIFYYTDQQKQKAEAFKAKVERSKAWSDPVVTEITAAKKFWPAEDEHQKYLIQNPGGYDNHYLRKISFDTKPAAK